MKPSPMEAEVLGWLFKGKTEGEIAEIRGRAPTTIRTEIHHLMLKAGASNRVGLIYTALREGWIESPRKP